MHATIEMKDSIDETGQVTIEVAMNIHEEMTPEVLSSEPTPTMLAANAILFLFQSGQIKNLIDAYLNFVEAAGEPPANPEA